MASLDRPPTAAPIAAFWAWWRREGAARFAAAIDDGDFESLHPEMGDLITAIHPDLQWELAPGKQARHTLCVTAAGDAALRPVAERWLRAGPEPDETWEYAPARRGDLATLTAKLGFGSWQLDLSEIRLVLHVHDERLTVDIACYHPLFGEMPDDACRSVTYLVLDWLLGEDDAERWLGVIDILTAEPGDGLPGDALVETVLALAGRHSEPSWVLMEGRTETGSRLLVTARRPLRWIDAPLLDQHIAVTLPYRGHQQDGLPTSEALEELRDREDDLTAALGPHAELLAHETSEGHRTLHYYSDSDDPSAADLVHQWAVRHPDATIDVSHDPAWSALRPYR